MTNTHQTSTTQRNPKEKTSAALNTTALSFCFFPSVHSCVFAWRQLKIKSIIFRQTFSKIATVLIMTSLQDHYCTIFTPFHFSPESNHVFYGAAADKMTEGGMSFVFWKYLAGARLWQTTDMVSSLNEENRHEREIWGCSFKLIWAMLHAGAATTLCNRPY